MVLGIEPRTERGTGLVLPVGKAIAHLHTVVNALARQWPITNEEAAAELAEVAEHIHDATAVEDLLSTTAFDALNEWKTNIATALASARQTATAAPEDAAAESDIATTVAAIATQSWPMFTLLDRELTGLSNADTDPGRLP